jgi:hypothetical protein
MALNDAILNGTSMITVTKMNSSSTRYGSVLLQAVFRCPIICMTKTYIRTNQAQKHCYSHTTTVGFPKPIKIGTNSTCSSARKEIDSYPTVNVYCTTCSVQIIRYKKKNGTKSSLIKCYIERVIEDCIHLLRDQYYNHAHTPLRTSSSSSSSPTTSEHATNNTNEQCKVYHNFHARHVPSHDPMHSVYHCPNCKTTIARYARIHNIPCLKWVGGKIRMSKR